MSQTHFAKNINNAIFLEFIFSDLKIVLAFTLLCRKVNLLWKEKIFTKFSSFSYCFAVARLHVLQNLKFYRITKDLN